jgi:ubiquinone/menaquinone biosynthesis C-methylase UbiE
MLAIYIILAFILVGLCFEIMDRIRRSKKPIPASPRSGKFFDSDFRKKLQPPEVILSRSGVENGMTVMDLGCGSGAYTTEAALKVGRKGRVYGIDLQQEMLDQVEKKLKGPKYKKLKNVELVKASAYKLPVKSNCIDVLFLVDVLNEIPDREKAIKEMRRVLKNKGIISVTEFFLDPDFRFKFATTNLFEKVRFTEVNSYGSLLHYTVQFQKH